MSWRSSIAVMSISSKVPESFRQLLGQLISVNNWVDKIYWLGEMCYLIIHFTKSVRHLTASEAVTCSQPLRNTVNLAKKNLSFQWWTHHIINPSITSISLIVPESFRQWLCTYKLSVNHWVTKTFHQVSQTISSFWDS